MTVPPSDLVHSANMKVGMATHISGRKRSRERGAPDVTKAGRRRAARMAAGMSSSHSTNIPESLRRVRKNRGSQRGRYVTVPMAAIRMIYSINLPSIPHSSLICLCFMITPIPAASILASTIYAFPGIIRESTTASTPAMTAVRMAVRFFS
jgi:hypothetical protein